MRRPTYHDPACDPRGTAYSLRASHLIDTFIDHVEGLGEARNQQVEQQKHDDDTKEQHERPRDTRIWQRANHVGRLRVENALHQRREEPIGRLHEADPGHR